MNKIIKFKLPLIILSYIICMYLIYLFYYSNNKNITTINIVAVSGTMIGAIATFLGGLDYIPIKKSKRKGYITCIIAIILPLPIILFIH